jgi:hypothetical protein
MAAAAQRSAGLPEDYPADRLGLPGKTPRIRAVWAENGQVDHAPALYAIDQQGREQKTNLTTMAYDSVGQEAQILAQEVASLLPGHPRPASERSLVYIAGSPTPAPGSRGGSRTS